MLSPCSLLSGGKAKAPSAGQQLFIKGTSAIFWIIYEGSQAEQLPFLITPHCLVKLSLYLRQNSNIGSTKNSMTQPKLGSAEVSDNVQLCPVN